MALGGLHLEALTTARLALEPVRPSDAEEMAPLMADLRLYAFTGGIPPTLEELRARYERQATGRSPDGAEWWCNWIARRREDGLAIGFMQATVTDDTEQAGRLTAVLAWALWVRFHGQGYAREAAAEMMRRLEASGADRFAAYIHPEHTASMGLARALGLVPTDERVDGEVVWERVDDPVNSRYTMRR
jgi:RimJ/RimL family protein N-acetyltransferase